ncbi:uncharacterized protein LOC143173597 [Aptenodytes patagonicus]|uniref:uncharacterized protein LOC143173597 n=1 Tax=Aptenodytes patagonicus TaxID=9234 RepID=UPI003FA16724
MKAGEGQGLSGCIWLWFAWAVSGLALLAAWAKRDTWTTTGFAEELPRLKLKKPEKDDGIGSAYRASQLDPGYEPWGRPRDVARGRAFSWLNPVLDPSWHPKETDRETLQKQAFQKGSSHTVPVSDEEREAMQEAGTPGADAGKKAEAADREELRKYYIPVTVAALGVLLSGIVVSCIVISRRRKRDPRTQRDEEAAGQANTDSAWKREDQTRDTGKAESGEGTKKDDVKIEALKHKQLSRATFFCGTWWRTVCKRVTRH